MTPPIITIDNSTADAVQALAVDLGISCRAVICRAVAMLQAQVAVDCGQAVPTAIAGKVAGAPLKTTVHEMGHHP